MKEKMKEVVTRHFHEREICYGDYNKIESTVEALFIRKDKLEEFIKDMELLFLSNERANKG